MLILDGVGRNQGPERGAVLAAEAPLVDVTFSRVSLQHALGVKLHVVREQEILHGTAEHLVGLIADHLRHAVVDVGGLVGGVHGPDALGGRFQEQSLAFFLLGEVSAGDFDLQPLDDQTAQQGRARGIDQKDRKPYPRQHGCGHVAGQERGHGEHGGMDCQSEEEKLPPGQRRQGAPPGVAPGNPDAAGCQDHRHSHPDAGASLNDAKDGCSGHGEHGRHGPEEQSGNAEHHGPGIEDDAGDVSPRRQHDHNAQDAQARSQDAFMPEGGTLPHVSLGDKEVEQEGARQKQRDVLDQWNQARHDNKLASRWFSTKS